MQLQEQTARRYADARGLIICKTYLDAGVSGNSSGPHAKSACRLSRRKDWYGHHARPGTATGNPLSLIAVSESFLEDDVNVEFSTEEGRARFKFLKVVGQTMDEIGIGRSYSAARGA